MICNFDSVSFNVLLLVLVLACHVPSPDRFSFRLTILLYRTRWPEGSDDAGCKCSPIGAATAVLSVKYRHSPQFHSRTVKLGSTGVSSRTSEACTGHPE